MPKKKSVTKASTVVSDKPKGDDDALPLTLYTSITGTHALLMMFCMLVLPRTSLMFEDIPPQASSADRPQYAFMAAITAWPAMSVAWTALGVAIIQAFWSGRAVSWIKADELKQTAKGNTPVRADQSMKELLRAWGATLFGTFIFHFLSVLLGAPMTINVPHTFALSLLISLLSVYPAARALGVPKVGSKANEDVILREKWSRLFNNFNAKTRAERALVYPAIGAVCGAWAGAYPIALDWDRPWQAWPLTPAFGAILGYILGSFNAIFVGAVYYWSRTVKDPFKTN